MTQIAEQGAVLTGLLNSYVAATTGLGSAQDQEDYRRVSDAVVRLVHALTAGDTDQFIKERLAFNWLVSDCYATQPKEFSPMARAIESIKP